MKTKFKYFFSYLAIVICIIIEFIPLPKGDKVFLIYAIIFPFKALFDSNVLSNRFEKRKEKKHETHYLMSK